MIQTCIQTSVLATLVITGILVCLAIGFRWGFSSALGKRLNQSYQTNVARFRENQRGRRES